MGAWIETFTFNIHEHTEPSHPTWVRGLKLYATTQEADQRVAPYVGAWIETVAMQETQKLCAVAPYVGAWIETSLMVGRVRAFRVAPYVGAWIETT